MTTYSFIASSVFHPPQDYLRWMWETLGLVEPVVPILSKAVKATGATHIVDLCSGGGGPHRLLLPQVQAATGNRELTMTLTDLWPHVDAWKEVGVDGTTSMCVDADYPIDRICSK